MVKVKAFPQTDYNYTQKDKPETRCPRILLRGHKKGVIFAFKNFVPSECKLGASSSFFSHVCLPVEKDFNLGDNF